MAKSSALNCCSSKPSSSKQVCFLKKNFGTSTAHFRQTEEYKQQAKISTPPPKRRSNERTICEGHPQHKRWERLFPEGVKIQYSQKQEEGTGAAYSQVCIFFLSLGMKPPGLFPWYAKRKLKVESGWLVMQSGQPPKSKRFWIPICRYLKPQGRSLAS